MDGTERVATDSAAVAADRAGISPSAGAPDAGAGQSGGSGRRSMQLGLLLYLAGLLPSFLLDAGWIACAVWSVACALLADRLFPASRSRQVAGALAALLGSTGLLFVLGTRQFAAALLLAVPVLAGLALRAAIGPRFLRPLRAVPALTVLVGAALAGGSYVALARTGAVAPMSDDFLFALRATEPPPPLDEAGQRAAMGVVRASLRGLDVDPGGLPERLTQRHDGGTWVTLFRPATSSHKARGEAGPGPLHLALAQAAKDALRQAPNRQVWDADLDRLAIQVDLGGREQALRPSWWRSALRAATDLVTPGKPAWDLLVYDAEPGLDGLAVTGPDDRTGVVLPADTLIEGWLTPRSTRKRFRIDDLRTVHGRLLRRAGLPQTVQPGEVPLRNFRTFSFVAPDGGSDRTVVLYRGNSLLQGEVTERLLLERIDLAGRWLLSTVEDNGRFDYEYFPTKDDHGRGYNEVRHAGSVYGLFHMVHLSMAEPELAAGADRYMEAGLLALDRVYRSLGTPPGADPQSGFMAFLEGRDGEESNSGASALTLLSFIERPRPEQIADPALGARTVRAGDDAIMDGLAATLLAMIDDQGRVYKLWTEAAQGGGVGKEPIYYPGEVMLALARYYELTGDPRWLDGAKRIGRRQIPWARKPWHVPDHWVMQALDVLDRVDPERSDEWRQGAYMMGRRYVGEHYAAPGRAMRPGPALPPPFPDYRGAYRRVQEVPRTTRAASRGEALGGVARIAWRHGDRAEAWERSLIEGARHLMEQQYVPDNSFFLPRPDEVQGAIRMGIIDMHCRIDNNQHGVVALDNALAALRRVEGEPR